MNRLVALRKLTLSSVRFERMTGMLKFYNGKQGLGWIENDPNDVCVHKG